jgi:DNA-binding transcriptional regulator YbjK
VADCVEAARAPPYGRLINVKEETVTTRTRTIAALAALSLATTAYIAEDLGSGMPEAAAAPVSAQTEGYLAGGSHVQDGIRITVKEFSSADSAHAEANLLLMRAYAAHRGSMVCDRTKEALRVRGIPGARGVVVDNRPWTGSRTKTATIVFAKGAFTFVLSTQAKPKQLRVGVLERASRREYRRLAA